ncbi:class I mannose-6-phosphate isomerase [Sphingomonas crocodyli]|uniref:Phosphoheptose isomerase n=1 Tax=Sphingomonas crocodyli TaxID=1979270 RepID=A0A437LXU3_9SPHN|nr:class I mannose-6-phosphate isomerase [Sphingomonas crocodyli]RVT90174.1 phosphoheptose isomerase [Sphingomonas crocodyli]
MTVTTLARHQVVKPWGRRDLSPLFKDQAAHEPQVGEIWYDDPADASRELLVKFLFTSERLSVQVHPDDAQAQERGYPRGKDEAWIVLSADATATIALGFKQRHSAEEVRRAALDGSIEHMLDWKPVRAGDVIYSKAGTVHAIGAGLRIIEIQQNLDLTYRFYDYGSDRELHLDDAIAVSNFGPFEPVSEARSVSDGRMILAENGAFVLERWELGGRWRLHDIARPIWLIPVEGELEVDNSTVCLGDAVIVEKGAIIHLSDHCLIYVAYSGTAPSTELITHAD